MSVALHRVLCLGCRNSCSMLPTPWHSSCSLVVLLLLFRRACPAIVLPVEPPALLVLLRALRLLALTLCLGSSSGCRLTGREGQPLLLFVWCLALIQGMVVGPSIHVD